MEEEKKEELQIPRKKRKVSLFKRRKKPNIRPFVQQKKHREYRKTLARVLLVFGIIFLLAALLFAIQKFLIPGLFLRNTIILSPQLNAPLNDSEIEQLIKESATDIKSVQFSSSSAVVSYILHGATVVYLSSEKDIKQQLALVNAIDRQVLGSGKQAISIDLRYNKPVVKY